VGGAGGSKGGAGGSKGGAAGAGGGKAGAGGSKAGAGGAVMDACAGKKCGESCLNCDPKDPSCGENPEFCDSTGQCSPKFPTCPAPTGCKTVADCPPIGGDCQICPDGTKNCPEVACVMGQCLTSVTSCPSGPMCKTDADCPQVDGCMPCPDGTLACPEDHCVNGQCAFSNPGCGGVSCGAQSAQGVGNCDLFLGYRWDGTSCQGIGGCSCAGQDCASLYPDPDTCAKAHASCPGANMCVNQPCGAPCSTCPPGAPCVFQSCDGFGQCVNGPAACGPQCKQASDCPLPGGPPCEICPDGSEACITAECTNGACTYAAPACQAIKCVTDKDCPPSMEPCQVCPDGSTICPQPACLGGFCSIGFPPDCMPPTLCTPQDAASLGDCKKFLGFAWNGSACAQINCECVGSACGSLYPDGDSCLKDHAVCAGGF
jgi:hypothetical protein